MGNRIKKKDPKVLMTVENNELINILNNIDGCVSLTHPVKFRAIDDECINETICGVDKEHHFIWKDSLLGNILFLNVEIWENVRIEKIFNFLFCEGKYEILEGSFTGEPLSFKNKNL